MRMQLHMYLGLHMFECTAVNICLGKYTGVSFLLKYSILILAD